MQVTNAQSRPTRHGVSKAGILDTLAFLKDVGLPTFSKGALIRRRKVVDMAERFGLDDKAMRRMQKLRRKYGPGLLILSVPYRKQIIALSGEDAEEILALSPEPFKLASLEKRSALDHFEPLNVLASHGPERDDRRRFNEEVLETGCPVHSMAPTFRAIVEQEMDVVAERAGRNGELTWDIFFEGWYAMVRHLILGPSGRDDTDFTDLLEKLRYRANYAFLKSKDEPAREEMLARLKAYLDRAEPGSLAARAAQVKKTDITKPEQQAPQWLFAFDPAGMASFRTLALLSAHPDYEQRVRAEIAESTGDPAPRLAFLRACFLEALRLWPTTPAIFRESTRDVPWGDGTVPANSNLLIFTPFFHRDDERLPFAHVMRPEIWFDENRRKGLSLVPFSQGPGICPAADFVPMIASMAMARLLERADIRLDPPDRLGSTDRLPGTLNNYKMKFTFAPRPVMV